VLRSIDTHEGACITSPAINDLYEAVSERQLTSVHAINYSMAYPLYVLARGDVSVSDLTWTTLSLPQIDDLVEQMSTDPRVGIVYRYCGGNDGDPKWIQWLNRAPDVSAFIARVKRQGTSLSVSRFTDHRHTEFVLVSRSAT
jgi:hypothetical protein